MKGWAILRVTEPYDIPILIERNVAKALASIRVENIKAAAVAYLGAKILKVFGVRPQLIVGEVSTKPLELRRVIQFPVRPREIKRITPNGGNCLLAQFEMPNCSLCVHVRGTSACLLVQRVNSAAPSGVGWNAWLGKLR